VTAPRAVERADGGITLVVLPVGQAADECVGFDLDRATALALLEQLAWSLGYRLLKLHAGPAARARVSEEVQQKALLAKRAPVKAGPA
jgi:hypothetical protein